jgi:hypothetical protein
MGVIKIMPCPDKKKEPVHNFYQHPFTKQQIQRRDIYRLITYTRAHYRPSSYYFLSPVRNPGSAYDGFGYL